MTQNSRGAVDYQYMEIRPEKPEDVEAVRQVNIAAFGRVNEADLVDALRQAASTVSFVAVCDRHIVGHIFFSPVSVEGDCTSKPKILGLAPLAVLPGYQRQGIGSALIQHSLRECFGLGFGAIVVLGYPEYYSRFGFVPAKEKGLKCEYSVPDDVFMVMELHHGALKGCSGVVKYPLEFANV